MSHGFPSGRYVDLKYIGENGFVFCTSLDSQKVRDIECNSKVGLTFWWEAIGYQIRIQGNATQISRHLAKRYWKTRSREAQIATMCCNQSEPLLSTQKMYSKFRKLKNKFEDQNISKPDNWGGFIVKPVSIEFLAFKENRLHVRELYKANGDGWQRTLLQP